MLSVNNEDIEQLCIRIEIIKKYRKNIFINAQYRHAAAAVKRLKSTSTYIVCHLKLSLLDHDVI